MTFTLILLWALAYYDLQEHILTGKWQCPQNSSISLFGAALTRLDLLTEVALLDWARVALCIVQDFPLKGPLGAHQCPPVQVSHL